ncbi:MAG: FtsK/SpoIIIE domain-containing protein [Janthinobacterium lividum]
MQLRLTVRGSERGPEHVEDVVVEAPAGTRFEEIRERLEAVTGRWPGAPRVGTSPVEHAVLGLPPLLHGVHLDVGEVPDDAGEVAEPARPWRLRVEAGPDAGLVLALGPGVRVVGRGDVDVPLDDPAVSRRHAVLELGDDDRVNRVTVRDEGSLNGTALLGSASRESASPGSASPGTASPGAASPGSGGGVAVTDPVELTLPARITVGDSILGLDTVAASGVVPADVRTDGEGHLLLNRSPRLDVDPPAQVLTWPAAPVAGEPSAFPWLALLLPLVVAGVLALVWTPLSLLLGIASPVLVAGQWWTQRRRLRSESARRDRAVAQARADVRTRYTQALEGERQRREDVAPGPARLLEEVLGRGSRLYERDVRDPDHLRLRIGTGTAEALGCTLRREERPRAWEAHDDEEPPSAALADVPVTVDLTEGAFGIAGERAETLGVLRHLVAQLAAWHSPAQVRIAVVSADTTTNLDWGWLSWLPHHDPLPTPLATLAADLDVRRAHHRRHRGADPAEKAMASAPVVVLILDGPAALRAEQDLAVLLREGPAYGIHIVCLDTDRTRLPAECRTVLDLPSGHVEGGLGRRDVRVDRVRAGWALLVSRGLSPLRDASPAGGGAELPVAVRLLDLLSAGTGEPGALARRWADGESGVRAVIGMSTQGPCVVDLAADGPHALVAGTTGSGKSVLLQTLVTSLAVQAPPQDLQFVLIDYKGGAAFAACTGLPHVAGVVTDLDDQLAGRVLRSLRAEVRRRERVLRTAGVGDLSDLAPDPSTGGRPPRLVLVVDEFRVLAEELPEFVDGLVRLAVVGRSLGIHLVLATQRPSGVVSPEIRANTNLRIALRVQDRSDAEDVVGDPSPAALSDREPGRAVLRRGNRAVEVFQTASLRGEPGDVTTRVVPVAFLGDEGPLVSDPTLVTGRAPGVSLVDDLPVLVDTVRAATRLRGLPLPPVPWLPPLPRQVLSAPAVTTTGLDWGLMDLPDEQRRATASWDLTEGGHLLVVGTTRSGRSTALRTLAAAAGRAGVPVEVSILDAGGTLGELADLPYVGSVVDRSQVWRAGRLLRRLQEEVDRRRENFARVGVRDLAAQHVLAAQHALAGSVPEPYLLLLVDGWDAWVGALADIDLGAGVDAFLRLLREASAVGVRIALTGDRALATGAVASACSQVLLLRLADRADAALLGVPVRDLPHEQPPGRGLLLREGGATETQVIFTAPAAGGGPAGSGPAAQRPARVRVAPLPGTVAVADLVSESDLHRTGDRIPVGRGGDDGSTVTLDVSGPVLVCGPAGSGRTTLLRALAQLACGPVAVVTGHPSGEQFFPGALWRGRADGTGLAELLALHPDTLVLVDDVTRPIAPALEEVLLHALDRPEGARVVATGDGGELVGAFRGLPALLRSARTTVLLGRGGSVPAEVLGRRPALAPADGAGAGFVVVDGVWTSVRCASAEPAIAPFTVVG